MIYVTYRTADDVIGYDQLAAVPARDETIELDGVSYLVYKRTWKAEPPRSEFPEVRHSVEVTLWLSSVIR